MSRNYANISTAIWKLGGDFAALSMQAQWTYMMLATQPDISAAGVLSLNVKRWTSRARNVTREVVVGALQELNAGRFVYFDTDTEELLIRTFVKSDGGYGNRKRKPVIERAAMDIESPALRAVLAEEFGKLGLPNEYLADGLSDPYAIAHPGDSGRAIEEPTPPVEPNSDIPAFPQVDSLSDSPSRFDGVVVTQGLLDVPQPSTHNPQPVPPSAGAIAPPREPGTALATLDEPLTETQRSKRITDAYAEHEPMCKWPAVNGVVLKAIRSKRYADDEIRDALLRLADEGRGVTVETLRVELAGLTPRDDNGRRDGALARVGQPPSNRDTRSTAAKRMQQALDVAARLDAQHATGGTP